MLRLSDCLEHATASLGCGRAGLGGEVRTLQVKARDGGARGSGGDRASAGGTCLARLFINQTVPRHKIAAMLLVHQC